MIKEKISITAIGSISPLGNSNEEVWENYKNNEHYINEKDFGSFKALVAELTKNGIEEIEKLKVSDSKYKNLDKSVLFAIYASRMAIENASWNANDNFGVNLGSSRGATTLFEKYHEDFLYRNKSETLASPTTTLGNISSWVAHDLQTKGPEISHSITCSTALHALLNGVAWLQSDMADMFLVGGSEAPLTPFTIAQMQAMKIYAKELLPRVSAQATLSGKQLEEYSYVCRSLDLSKEKNTMVLGEGASVACLEKGIKENALAVIEGVGYATEVLKHNVSISTNADCFQRSMKMALGDLNTDDIDAIVMHAPGTIKGDLSELNAIKKVFCNKLPVLTTNKWKIGHTFGASGMLSLELAVLMLQHQQFISIPFINYNTLPKQLNRILVNAVGFGGNAVSVLLKKTD